MAQRSTPPTLQVYSSTAINSTLISQGTIADYTSLMWDTGYSDIGRIQFTVPSTAVNLTRIQIGRYVVRNDTAEVAIITSIQDNIQSDSNTITVIGYSAAQYYLNKKIVTRYTAIRSGATRYGQFEQTLISYAFGCGTTINDTFVFAGDLSLTHTCDFAADYVYKKTYWDYAQTVLQDNNAGMSCFYDSTTKKCKFKTYKGVDRRTSVILRRDLGNIVSAQYNNSLEGTVNKVYVRCNQLSSKVLTPSGVPVITYYANGTYNTTLDYDTHIGWDVYETAITIDGITKESTQVDADGVTTKITVLDYNATVEAMVAAAKAEIKLPSENYTVDIAVDNYGHAFNIGDVITYTDTVRGKSVAMRVIKAAETYDNNGYRCTVTLGTPLRVITDYIKLR